MRIGLALILSTGVAAPALALPERVIGTWCFNNNQERMFVDEFGFGFNEHTVCDTEKYADTTAGFSATLACKNARIIGEEVIFTDEHHLDMTAVFVSPNLMTIQLSADIGDQVFIRCDG